MKNLIKLSFLLCITFVISCKSIEPMSEKIIEEYKQQGYSVGVIEPKSNEKCNYVITIQGSDLKYDPINIEDKQFAKILSKKTTIIFKYLGLRMQNRCGNLSPIRLLEVLESKE